MHVPARKTWFMIADGTKARLFESAGWRQGWKLLDEWDDAAARAPSRELGDNKPTRGVKSGSGARFAIDPSSEHDKAEDSFIRERADFLNDAANGERFDQLVLTAPPAALGLFRKRLSPATTQRCISMLDKDLTNVPEPELRDYFQTNLKRW
ncbi:MAG: host attachment protein [Pseudomonadota bacterium]